MSFVVVAAYRTLPGKEDEVLRHLARAAEASRREPGNLQYRVHRGAEDPRTVLLYEEYGSAADFDAHCASTHFAEIVKGRVIPLLESREVRRLVPQDGAAAEGAA